MQTHEQEPTVDFRIYNVRSGSDADEYQADYSDMSDTLKALIATSLAEGASEPQAGDLLADIKGRLKPECIAAVYDAWATEASFDPGAIGCEEAGWIACDSQGNQLAYRVHLTEDRDSPCGFAWYTEAYSWDEESRLWEEESDCGGIWWGYPDAASLEHVIPHAGKVNWHDAGLRAVRVRPDLLDKIGVGDDTGISRRAYLQELKGKSRAFWAMNDRPDPPATLKGWLSKLSDEQMAPELRKKALDAATAALASVRDMEILATGYECPRGSIDIVASRHGELHFTRVRFTELADPDRIAYPKPFDLSAEPTMSPFKRSFIDASDSFLDKLQGTDREPVSVYFGVVDIVKIPGNDCFTTRWNQDAFHIEQSITDYDFERAILTQSRGEESLGHPISYVKFPHPAELEAINSQWRNIERPYMGSEHETHITLKKSDGLWSCSASAWAEGKMLLANATAETFFGAYSNAFDALSTQCALENQALLTYNPANPTRPFKSVGEMIKYERIDTSWEPPSIEERSTRANDPASVAKPVRAREAAPARSAR